MSHTTPSQHILVIDDQSSARNTLKLALTFERNTVELACDGPGALKKLTKKKFDIVFTDLVMPQMTGLHLVRSIRSKYPGQVIVMVTGNPDFLGPNQTKTNPVDIIITKPFSLGTIANTLERAHEINKANRKKSEPSLPPPSTPSLVQSPVNKKRPIPEPLCTNTLTTTFFYRRLFQTVKEKTWWSCQKFDAVFRRCKFCF